MFRKFFFLMKIDNILEVDHFDQISLSIFIILFKWLGIRTEYIDAKKVLLVHCTMAL